MILTGSEIAEALRRREIEIDPYDEAQLNPNSYNYRLGGDMILTSDHASYGDIRIPPGGYVLEPGNLYLGHTLETIGSSRYVTTLLGRSSTGRLGLFLNITADLGHLGSSSRWTLEMTTVQPLRVYSGMQIGQVAFWVAQGQPSTYQGRYNLDREPTLCRDSDLITMPRELER